MLLMEELQEVRQMVTQQMEAYGFVRPTLFLVGTASRLGYTCTSFPGDLSRAVTSMRSLGQRLAAEHPEVGRLVRAYFAAIGLFTFPSDERAPREVLLIHGLEIATSEQQAVVYEVLRDRTQHSQPFTALQEFHSKDYTPEHPALQAFVDGYMSFD
jgi:hypothetical protein